MGKSVMLALVLFSMLALGKTTDQKSTDSQRLISIESKIEEIQKSNLIHINAQENAEKFQEKIISERESHQQFVENMFSTFITYVLGILGVTGILYTLLTWFFGNSAKEHFSEKFDSHVADAKRQALERLDQFKTEMNDYASILKKEREYLDQRITVVKDKTNNLTQEIDLLRNAGYSIKIISLNDMDLFIADLNDTDVLIISVDEKTDLLKVFEQINLKINIAAKKIPIAIYVKGRNDTLNKLLEQYPLALSANMPLTLINSIYTISKVKSLLRG